MLATFTQFFRSLCSLLEEGIGSQPDPGVIRIRKEFSAPIIPRRQARQSVLATMLEKTLEEEVGFESLSVFGHVTCCDIRIAQGLTDVLSRCNSVCVGSQGLCQALMNLLNRRVGLSGSRTNLRHCVVDLLRQLTLLDIGNDAVYSTRGCIEIRACRLYVRHCLPDLACHLLIP